MKTIGIVLLSIGLLSLFGGIIHPSGAMVEVVIIGYVFKFGLIFGGLVLINKGKPKDENNVHSDSHKNQNTLKERFPELLEHFTSAIEITNNSKELIFSMKDSLISNGKMGLFVYKLCYNNKDLILSCTFEDDDYKLAVSSEEKIGNIQDITDSKKIKWTDIVENLNSNIDSDHNLKTIQYISDLSKNVKKEISKRNLMALKALAEKKINELSDSREREGICIKNFQEYVKPFQEKKTFDNEEEEKAFNLHYEKVQKEIKDFQDQDAKLEKECSDLNIEIRLLCKELNIPLEGNK